MDKIAFGRRIYKARKERGLTSDNLSEICDMAPVFVRQIESGTRLPSLPKLIILCNALKVSPSYLLATDLDFPDPNDDTIKQLVALTRSLSVKQLEMVYSTVKAMVAHI